MIGLADDVAARCFPAAPRTAGTATLERLGGEALAPRVRLLDPPRPASAPALVGVRPLPRRRGAARVWRLRL